MTDSKSTCFTEYGEYVPVFQRLPMFQKQFPLSDGYAVQTEAKDPLSYKPALHQLYLECIRSGHSPESMGLPPIASFNSVVFTASLVKDGVVLCSGSTLQPIEFQKDYENGETNALQRLVARSGFPGDPYDLDVSTNLGVRIDLPSSTEDDPDYTPVSEDKDPAEEPRLVEVPTPPVAVSDIPPHLQQQINAMCTALDANGEKYDEPTTKQQALVFIREHRGGGRQAS